MAVRAHTPARNSPTERSRERLRSRSSRVDQVDDRDTFVSLGGDSLAYVEMSVALEDHLGHLPPHWHTTPIGDLAASRVATGQTPRVETTIVLRAVAITMIVGNHAGWFDLPGTAHVLIAIAGFNFARFGLRATTGPMADHRPHRRPVCRCGSARSPPLTTDYQWTHALLIHSVIGEPGSRYSYWFIETLLYLLIPLTALFAFPPLRPIRTGPSALPPRSSSSPSGSPSASTSSTCPASATNSSGPKKCCGSSPSAGPPPTPTPPVAGLLLTALVLAGSHGFFGNPQRDAFLGSGRCCSSGCPRPCPRGCAPSIVAVASASLYIYLVHWQVLPTSGRPPALAVGAGVAAGVAASRATELARVLTSRYRPIVARHDRSTAGSNAAGNPYLTDGPITVLPQSTRDRADVSTAKTAAEVD